MCFGQHDGSPSGFPQTFGSLCLPHALDFTRQRGLPFWAFSGKATMLFHGALLDALLSCPDARSMVLKSFDEGQKLDDEKGHNH
jgi:hypothetical protein